MRKSSSPPPRWMASPRSPTCGFSLTSTRTRTRPSSWPAPTQASPRAAGLRCARRCTHPASMVLASGFLQRGRHTGPIQSDSPSSSCCRSTVNHPHPHLTLTLTRALVHVLGLARATDPIVAFALVRRHAAPRRSGLGGRNSHPRCDAAPEPRRTQPRSHPGPHPQNCDAHPNPSAGEAIPAPRRAQRRSCPLMVRAPRQRVAHLTGRLLRRCRPTARSRSRFRPALVTAPRHASPTPLTQSSPPTLHSAADSSGYSTYASTYSSRSAGYASSWPLSKLGV